MFFKAASYFVYSYKQLVPFMRTMIAHFLLFYAAFLPYSLTSR